MPKIFQDPGVALWWLPENEWTKSQFKNTSTFDEKGNLKITIPSTKNTTKRLTTAITYKLYKNNKNWSKRNIISTLWLYFQSTRLWQSMYRNRWNIRKSVWINMNDFQTHSFTSASSEPLRPWYSRAFTVLSLSSSFFLRWNIFQANVKSRS